MEHEHRRRCRLRGDGGVVIVEAGIAALLTVTLLFAVLEFGFGFRDYLTVANITRDGARTGSSRGNDLLADYDIVQAVQRASAGISASQIQYFVVYDAGSFNGSLSSVNSTCEAGTSVQSVCNVYHPSDFARPSTDFGCKVSPPSPDQFWCPSTRRINARVSTGGPPNYLGVYVKVRHDNITGFFGSGYTFTDQTIIRIEPTQP
jgi:Flp pilus assembly protein TadG